MKRGRMIYALLATVRTDRSAAALVAANLFLFAQAWWAGTPIGSVLVIYWIELLIIGFWTCLKLGVIARWRALGWIPGFLLIYMVPVSLFGIVVGGTLDNEFMGTDFQSNFSLWPYVLGSLALFLSRGYSFGVNFLGRREYEDARPEEQVGVAVMRAFPLFAISIVGGFVAGFLNSSAVLALIVLPVKILVDLAAHVASHGLLEVDGGLPVRSPAKV